jgi:hypothetical protein
LAAKRGSAAAKSKTQKPSRIGKVQISSWQTPEAVRQLRILAAEQGTSMQALMAEGLNYVFAKYGKPQIAKP